MSEAARLQRQHVETAHTAFYTAIESADLDLLGAIWVDGPRAADVVCVHPGWPTLRGRSSVLRSFAVICANTPYLQFFLTDVAISVTGDVAVVTCVENILTGIARPAPDPADGSDGLEDATGGGLAGGTAVATNVFLRTPGGWRLWVHHASPVLTSDDDDEDDGDEDVGLLEDPRSGEEPS